MNRHRIAIMTAKTLIKNTNNSISKPMYQSEFLKHLIRFPFSKQELISPFDFHNNLNKVYLIKKEVIGKLKEIYSLKKLFEILSINNLLVGISYQNCDSNYSKISKYLNENKSNYINGIKKIEIPGVINFNEIENSFTTKYIDNNPNLNYIDGFEIIDQEFASFLNQKFYNGLKMFICYYSTIENKILLIINLNQTSYIYEIVSINQDGGDIIIEYLIELKKIKNDTTYDIDSLINFVFQTIRTNGIDKLIKNENLISIDDNLVLSFHPINKAFNKNIKKSNFIQLQNKGNNLSNHHDNNQRVESIDDYIPPIPLAIKDINKDFTSKPLIGFENIGANCYMNSTLQCLCHIRRFVNYIKYHHDLQEIVKNDLRKEKLCSAFKLLIENSYPF